ncbi:major facilitator superfamily transporter quinolone resistance protein [Halococcus saccharolyticus DSM 5350]|uniref:Major facilitator superfamily transporter quinolone resistance protein n=2 Tax=Halococcus saccharolyticus TaxID=62319 RepID=M0MSE4_9EURY|nr:major facilitator superfamily transporter quinolone resistance protein [Halococcus saccharolyticus DSM 5350]
MSVGPFDLDRRILALALARMADSLGNSFLIVVLPLYIASGSVAGGAFGLTEALVTGLILSVFGFLNSGVQPFAGRLSDTAGKRKVFIVLGLVVLTIANFAYSFAGDYVSLLLIRALQGIGVAFTVTATIALVNELATAETRGGNMGIFNTFRLVGFGTGPLIAGAVVSGGPYTLPIFGTLSGFDAAFYIAALGALVSAVVVTIFVSDADETDDTEATDTNDDGFGIAVLAHDDDHLLDPVFTLGVASLFMAIGIALFSTIQPEINARLDQGATLFGIEFAAFTAAQVLLQAPIGSASDRLGRRPFIVAGLLLLVPATLAQGFVVEPWQMVGARFVQGVAGAMVFAPSLALAGDLATGGESGTKLSVLTMSFGLGTAIGPLASGYLIRYGLAAPFAAGAAAAAIGAVLVYTQVEETVALDRGPTAAPEAVGESSATESGASADD